MLIVNYNIFHIIFGLFLLECIYTASQKSAAPNLIDNYVNSHCIFKFFSLAESLEN